MAWRLAKALETLRAQVNAKWPNRNKSWDGTIGDTAHASRTSDHNPDSHGVVRAFDITHDPTHGFDSYAFAEKLRQSRDVRIKYVISNRRIFSSLVQPWLWRPYSGSNPHDHHVHVSVMATSLGDRPERWTAVEAPSGTPTPILTQGKGSWYSQYQGKYKWVDRGDKPGSAALGVKDQHQGIAIHNQATLGKWFEVHAPNGRISIEQQTDIGPAHATGRLIDISAAAAERFGYSPSNFPTNGVFGWHQIDPPREVAALSPKEQAAKYYEIRNAPAHVALGWSPLTLYEYDEKANVSWYGNFDYDPEFIKGDQTRYLGKNNEFVDRLSDVNKQYGEKALKPKSQGWYNWLGDQLERAHKSGTGFWEGDNADYALERNKTAVEEIYKKANDLGIKVLLKNPDAQTIKDFAKYAAGCVFEEGAMMPLDFAKARKDVAPGLGATFVRFGKQETAQVEDQVEQVPNTSCQWGPKEYEGMQIKLSNVPGGPVPEVHNEKWLQTVLQKAGYYKGPIDGIVGPLTIKAMIGYVGKA